MTDRTKDEISKDLNRTKTSDRINTKEGQAELERVLQAVAYCLPDISYCQGMNFIVSVTIAVMEDEEQGFYVFMHLVLNRDIRTLFLPVSEQYDV